MSEFVIFNKYNFFEEAEEFIQVLKSNGIDYQFIDDSLDIDPLFVGSSNHQKQYLLKLKQDDFEKANKLLESIADNILTDIDKDHYLFEFTDKELLEIIHKPDEWSVFDYRLAQKLLKDKGFNINDELLNTLKQKRIEKLSQPDKEQGHWIVIGYIFAICGGLIGLILGWYIWKYQKPLPNGEKVYVYSEKNRRHGNNIFIISIIVFPVSFLIKVLSNF